MTTESKTWKVGDIYHQAQIMRHGRGLDYDCPPRETKAEAENDLAEALAMMSDRERQQSAVESYVRAYEVLDSQADGSIGTAIGR